MARGRHPAYADPKYPTNALLGYMSKEENRRSWAEPDAIATAIYLLVSHGQRIPIRVPLGADAYGMITMDLEGIKGTWMSLKISVSAWERQSSWIPLAFYRKPRGRARDRKIDSFSLFPPDLITLSTGLSL